MKNKKLLFLIILIPCIAAYVVYNSKNEYIIPKLALSVYATDIDLDGDNDVIVGHRTSWGDTNTSITILRNNNNILEIIDTSKTYCGKQENIFCIDVNNDSFPDIITKYANRINNEPVLFLRIWYNNMGSFTSKIDIDIHSSYSVNYISHGDVNGDNYQDIVIASNQGQFWGVLYNKGNGSFFEPQYTSMPDSYPQDIACGDLNADGREDVAIAGASIKIFYSLPNNLFQLVYIENANVTQVDLIDFDKDKDIDIVGFADMSFGNEAHIINFENINNSYFKHSFIRTKPAAGDFDVTDLNNDSLPDIILTLYTNDIHTGATDTTTGVNILYNLGNFQLSSPQFVMIKSYAHSSHSTYVEDIDNNKYKDIILVRNVKTFPGLCILYNDANGNFVNEPVLVNKLRSVDNINFTAFPNPVLESTNFSIDLKAESNVKFCVYDIKGELIETICNQKLQKGYYQWQYNNFQHSGVYIASIKINDKVYQTIKLFKC